MPTTSSRRRGCDGPVSTHSSVRDQRAYLVRIVTRQALNRLRTLARRREEYVGEWLPEPVATNPDVAADVELAENLSLAMLTVLETLGPAERAVSCCARCSTRRMTRSRRRSASQPLPSARSPTGPANTSPPGAHVCPSARPSNTEALERFLAAIRYGDLQSLLEVLAPDVVIVADGGGVVPAARRPVEGAQRVARLLITGLRSVDIETAAVWLNGSPAIRIDAGPRFTAAVSVAVEGGRISRIYVVANPQKLARVDQITELTRS